MKLGIFTAVVVEQWRQRNVQKNVMHVRNCYFANLAIAFLPFSIVLSINEGPSDSLFVDNESVCLSLDTSDLKLLEWTSFLFVIADTCIKMKLNIYLHKYSVISKLLKDCKFPRQKKIFLFLFFEAVMYFTFLWKIIVPLRDYDCC